ncbi:MAG: TonB-dependent receptor [Bacteroidia bacterium]|nr:TonB-dependent receptor [Bacteroidia bacterium]
MKNYFTFLGILIVVLSTAQAQSDTTKIESITPVEIIGNSGSLIVDTSFTVSKTSVSFIDEIQVASKVNQEVIKQQVITELKGLLDNVTGVNRLWESTGRIGDGASYYSMRGFSVQPTMINGMPALSQTIIDPANIESIDVIKGPSGSLYGAAVTSYGGLININTKKAYSHFGGDITYITGAFGLNRIQSDINIPLSNKTSIRINSAIHKQGSFQDAGFNQYTFIAPSVRVKASKRLTFFINAEFKNGEGANAPMIFLNRYAPLSFTNISLFDSIYGRSFTSNDLTIRNESYNLQAQAWFDLGKNWKTQTVLSRTSSKSIGFYHYLWDVSNGNDFTRYISRIAGETQGTGVQQNISGSFDLLRFKNKVLIGLDYFERNISNFGSPWISNGKVSLKNQTDSGNLSQAFINEATSNAHPSLSFVRLVNKSLYFNDIININKSMSLSLGVRVDNFSGKPTAWSTVDLKSQTTVSPRLGLVIKPIGESFAIFGNYLNGFNYLDPATVSNIDGSNPYLKVFEPEKANQWETGLKWTGFKNNIQFIASYYQINVINMVMSDALNPNDFNQGGSVLSKGIEFSLSGNITSNVKFIGGFSHNNSKVTNDAPNAGYLGLRPESSGPANMANAWVLYRLPINGLFDGFSLGAGLNYTGEHLTLNRSTSGTFTLPSYTIYNASINWENEIIGLVLRANNLLDVKYYTGWSTVSPQAPRYISLSIRCKF